MEFAFGQDEEDLRSTVRAFLVQHLGASWQNAGPFGHRTDEMFEVALRFNRALGKKGWLAPAWPREFGGLGASVFQQMVFNEEFGYFGAPDTGTRVFGAGMIGPTLIVHGTKEQQARYLPGINRGEDIWCQGYSEPNAGSDLAALRTTATRDGDDYVINGQKIWTSGAHYANQMFCLVRTDPDAPKHRGISFLIIDDLPQQEGVTIRPIKNMANRHHFNEVFFEDVRVPVQNLVGRENAGWGVAMTLLEFERSGISVTASQRRALERLVPLVKAAAGRSTAQKLRWGLADLVVANGVGRMLGYEIGHLQTRGEQLTHQASAIKVFQSELDQRIGTYSLTVVGLGGLVRGCDRHAPIDGDAIESLIEAVAATVYSGTNEIQRSIIATRGLGLPRE